MKEITTHHDGHGLTESISVVAVDDVGPGGAHHLYRFYVKEPCADGGGFAVTLVGELQFQKGPRNDPDSTTGLLSVAVLAALADQLADFQDGPYPSVQGAYALNDIENAMARLRERADERAARQVLGTNQL